MSNPYAPPETESWADIALPLGTEFLFNQKCLAVANHVELPRLCVITATRVPEQFARTTTLVTGSSDRFLDALQVLVQRSATRSLSRENPISDTAKSGI